MMKFVSPQFEKLNYFLLMCALVAGLIGMFIIWDVSALSLNEIKQWDCCTNYTIVNNTFTNTTFNNNGTSSHNLLLNLTSYDDHSQYAYLNGRTTGQELDGGITNNAALILNSSANADLDYSTIRLNPRDGRVSIGTNSNFNSLTVNGGADFNGSVRIGTKGVSSYPLMVATELTGAANILEIGNTYTATDTYGNCILFNGHSTFSSMGRICNLWTYANNTNTYYSFQVRSGGTANVEKMRLNNNGNLSLGVTSSTAQLHTTGTVRFAGYGAGSLNTDVNGNLYVSSDEKIKTDIKNYTGGISKIKLVKPITFKFKPESGLDTVKEYTGYSAQNLLTAIPEAVSIKEDSKYIVENVFKGKTENEDINIMKEVKLGTYTYSVSDSAILATLINAVKEQQIIIDNQQKEIDNLEIRITKLEGGKV